jgi:hypothetical protein
MPDNSTNIRQTRQVAKPVIKFLIGFIAGLCAAFLPRITAALAVAGNEDGVLLFGSSYIGLALFFSLLVGVIVMILEWGVPREPRATFMMAIGVPALITGSLNTSSGVDTANKQAQQNQQLTQQLQDFANIPTLPSRSIQPLSSNEGFDVVKQQDLAWLDMVGIDAAYAQVPVGQRQPTTVAQAGITIKEPVYYIVLDETASKQQAKERAQQLQTDVPGAVAVQSGGQYLILYSGQPMKRTEAVLVTLKLKKQFHLQPKLMPAQ